MQHGSGYIQGRCFEATSSAKGKLQQQVK